MAKCGLSTERLCHLSLDYIYLNEGENFAHEPIDSESIYVLRDGSAEVRTDAGETCALKRHDVLFLALETPFHSPTQGMDPRR